jgi:hypothetical protein
MCVHVCVCVHVVHPLRNKSFRVHTLLRSCTCAGFPSYTGLRCARHFVQTINKHQASWQATTAAAVKPLSSNNGRPTLFVLTPIHPPTLPHIPPPLLTHTPIPPPTIIVVADWAQGGCWCTCSSSRPTPQPAHAGCNHLFQTHPSLITTPRFTSEHRTIREKFVG